MADLKLHYDFDTDCSLEASGGYGPTLGITRATSAKMEGADGWLREVQAGEARFQGAAVGHNVALQSEDITTTWTATASNSTANAATDPNGGSTADKLYDDSSPTTNHYINQAVSGLRAGQEYIFSAYLKAAEYSDAGLYAAGINDGKIFDLDTGAVGINIGGAPDDFGIEDIGSGWYRCWIKVTIASTTTSFRVYLSEDGTGTSYTGDGASGVYVWGVMLEDVSGAWDSENLILQSEDFSTTWVTNGTGNIEVNATTDPNGGNTADRLWLDGSTGNVGQTFTLPDPGHYVYSLYAKAGVAPGIAFQINLFSQGNQVAYIDLETLTIHSSHADTVVTLTSVGNGWVRISVEFFTNSSDLVGTSAFYCSNGDGNLGVTDDDIYLWGAQVERKKPAQSGAGTYTATTTAAVTNYSPSTYIATTTAAVSSLSGANDGLLVEEARTNICTYSEEFDNAAWTKTRATVTGDQTVAPDGSLTADLLSDDGSTGTNTVNVEDAQALSTSTAYTASVFAKADQLSWIRMQCNNQDAYAFYDLSSGAVGATQGSEVDDSGIEDYGNGWYRCWFTFTSDAVSTANVFRINIADDDNDVSVDLDGTSSIFVWGAQLEAGAFPTSYIPTTTASVTRNADDVTSTDMSFLGTNTKGTGTYYAHGVVNGKPGGTADRPIVEVYQSGGNFVAMRQLNGGALLYGWTGGGSANFFGNAGTLVVGTEFRATLGFAEDDVAACFDGALGSSSTNVDPPAADQTTIGIGRTSVGAHWNGLIKEIAYIDERLTNDELSDLSDGTTTISDDYIGDDFLLRRQRQGYQRRKARLQGIGGRTWAGRRIR